ncbi:hypothetical protein HK096_011515, partial [Nowakowskiella sp. JEL0078]
MASKCYLNIRPGCHFNAVLTVYPINTGHLLVESGDRLQVLDFHIDPSSHSSSLNSASAYWALGLNISKKSSRPALFPLTCIVGNANMSFSPDGSLLATITDPSTFVLIRDEEDEAEEFYTRIVPIFLIFLSVYARLILLFKKPNKKDRGLPGEKLRNPVIRNWLIITITVVGLLTIGITIYLLIVLPKTNDGITVEQSTNMQNITTSISINSYLTQSESSQNSTSGIPGSAKSPDVKLLAHGFISVPISKNTESNQIETSNDHSPTSTYSVIITQTTILNSLVSSRSFTSIPTFSTKLFSLTSSEVQSQSSKSHTQIGSTPTY